MGVSGLGSGSATHGEDREQMTMLPPGNPPCPDSTGRTGAPSPWTYTWGVVGVRFLALPVNRQRRPQELVSSVGNIAELAQEGTRARAGEDAAPMQRHSLLSV